MVTLTDISLNNTLGIITLDDNLVHKYCTSIQWEKDNATPVGIAKVTMQYDAQILKYWTNYNGIVVIHAQLSKTQSDNKSIINLPNTSLNSQSIDKIYQTKDHEKIKIINQEYNYSFIGHIDNIKQIGQNIILYLKDLGWKFTQKVPKEFRQAYIAGQTLDIAFQAICEFIGVQFAYTFDKLKEYNFSVDGYSIEKDGTIIETVPDILSEYKNELEDSENEEEDVSQTVMPNDFKDATKNSQNPETATIQQNNRKETSNLSKTNLDNNEIDTELQKDFEEKIKDLFIGNTIYDSNITDAILNYDAITVEPKIITSSDASNTSVSNQSDLSNNNFDWSKASQVVNKYFTRNNPNNNTIIQSFRGCGNNWTCLVSVCNGYSQYRNTNDINKIVSEMRTCFQ